MQLLTLMTNLNVPIAPSKTYAVSTSLEFLGVLLDSENMIACLRPDKLDGGTAAFTLAFFGFLQVIEFTEEVGQLLAKHHGKFACFSTQCLTHAWTVANRMSLCDKEIWKLSKDRTVRLQYFEKIA